MKAHRIICLFFALGTAAVALAADPTGTWKWTTRLPNGDIETTLKLESTDGKLAGAYSNQFGDTAISNLSLQDDVIAFDVVRDLGGNLKFADWNTGGQTFAVSVNGTTNSVLNSIEIAANAGGPNKPRSEEHTSELQ